MEQKQFLPTKRKHFSFFRGTKRLVSVNICSVEGNSAGIFVSIVHSNFRNKGKMNICYFRGDETAVLGAIKAQLPFSEGKYQLLNSWDKISFSTIFYHMNFQLPHPNRSLTSESATFSYCPTYNLFTSWNTNQILISKDLFVNLNRTESHHCVNLLSVNKSQTNWTVSLIKS